MAISYVLEEAIGLVAKFMTNYEYAIVGVGGNKTINIVRKKL